MVFFEKSEPAPSSLSSMKSYRESDVVERLCADFKNKCYLCETKGPNSINVEHFRPHRGDKTLKYAWENLFYSCSHCNNTKAMLERDETFCNEGILNCTCRADCVDTWISYRVETFPRYIVKLANERITNGKDSSRIDNTIRLLDAIYNSTDTPIKKREAENLKHHLISEIERFLDLIKACKDSDESNLSEKIKQVKKELDNDSAFTAFKRWIVRDDADLLQQIESVQ
ncbi:MAG: HNH endonuclease [Prevotella sp.]|nr:HNH endonuclease [Prevotella sp.]